MRDTLGFLAVVASLVFVGMEIHQNTIVARAQTRQALADQAIALQGLYVQDDALARNFWRFLAWEGEPPTSMVREFPRMRFLIESTMIQRENVFLQAREGVIDESVLRSYGWSRGGLFRTPLFRVEWSRMRSQYNPDFVTAFEAEYDLAP